jgi:DNA-binding IclR family transcriptional regulator
MVSNEFAWTGETNRSVDRALALVKLVATSSQPLRFVDLEQQSGLPKATLHQLIGSLLSAGWLSRDPESGWLSVGLGAFEIGTRFPVQQTLREVAAPVLAGLLAEFNETFHFGMLTEGDVVYIDRAVSSQTVRYAAPLGHRLPAYATGLGKAMLSSLSDEDVREFYPDGLHSITEHTITSIDALVDELQLTRERGFALEDQESTPGVRCVGVLVPIQSRVLAMSMAIPVIRVTIDDLVQAAPRLQQAAATIADRLAVFDWFSGVGPAEVDA